MPSYTIHLTAPLSNTFRATQVAGLFDLPHEELQSRLSHTLTAELPGLDEDWTIGAIVGPSGSGKTTLARAAYGDALHQPLPWPEDLPIVECLERSDVGGQRSEVGDQRSGNASSLTSDLRPLTSLKHLLRVLTAVGLSSPPSWLRPYRVLSTGERFRADLARAVLSRTLAPSHSHTVYEGARVTECERGLLVFDEFTGALDRTVACTASASLARLLRRAEGSEVRVQGSGGEGGTSSPLNPEPRTLNSLRFVALSCHTDFLAWLNPDWVLDLAHESGRGGEWESGRLAGEHHLARLPLAHSPTLPLSFRPHWPRGCLQRPALRLAVRRVPQALWPRFAKHHYLTGGLSTAATCYGAFWEPERSEVRGQKSELSAPTSDLCSPTSSPIAFCAVVAALGWKRTKRITRLVVLPEFQGLGIGAKLAEIVAEHQRDQGHRVTITASHPAIVAWCSHSPRWRYLGLKKTGSTQQRFGGRAIRSSTGRAVAAWEFAGVSGE